MRTKAEIELDKQRYNSQILEYIWNSAKSNNNWNKETAKILADMHNLDYKLVLKIGKSAKIKSKFKALDKAIAKKEKAIREKIKKDK